MNDENNFMQAYAKLKSELIQVIDNIPTKLSTTHNALTLSDPAFPMELAKEIARIYESEQEQKIAAADSLAVEFTDGKLKTLLKTLKKQYLSLINESKFQLPPNDPIFCSVDAFSQIEWGLQEVPHTKMLAFFLDPEREHGLKQLPMGFFLAATSLTESETGLDVENYHEIDVHKIFAELWIPIKGKEDRRIDLLIQMQKPKCRILIEGKINAQQSLDQLPDYADWFKPQENDILIYLTPNDTKNEDLKEPWQALTWENVALAFCALVNYCETDQTEKEKISHDGFELLRLWTSTLLHHVCGVPAVCCKPEDDTLLNVVAHASHIIKVKEILEKYKGEQYADKQIA
jgi:hypothetical protein